MTSASALKKATTIEPGDVVTAYLPGVSETKRRPAIVISTNDYHAARPDVLPAIITSRVEDADTEFDCVLFDWKEAGLRSPSAMHSYLFSVEQREVVRLGHLFEVDWREVRRRLKQALEV